MVSEDTGYKHSDYLHRQNDLYAEAKYAIVARLLPRENGLRALNAGCGSGEMTALLSANKTWSVDAIDTDPRAIALSEKMRSDLGLTNVTISLSSIESHRAPDSYYDVIVCNDVLEHIEDDVAAIQSLHRLLKKGGTLAISVPALQSLFGHHDTMLGHYRRYDKQELIGKLSDLFDVVHCRYFGFSLIPVALWYSKITRKDYPTENVAANPLTRTILNTIFKTETALGSPLGTSLLAIVTKK